MRPAPAAAHKERQVKAFRLAGGAGALVCAALAIASPDAAAQQAALVRIGDMLARDGYQPTHGPQSGFLKQGQSARFSIWLQPGMSYVVRATCDQECSDLDLELRRGEQTIESDRAPAATPEVKVRPVGAGWYQVRVIMAACSREPCGYAARTFGR
jgi:hypothetical protein